MSSRNIYWCISAINHTMRGEPRVTLGWHLVSETDRDEAYAKTLTGDIQRMHNEDKLSDWQATPACGHLGGGLYSGDIGRLDLVHTANINPPITFRGCDWMAWVDGDEETGPYGFGPTEEAAILDLQKELS